jgi:hypothetical protein
MFKTKEERVFHPELLGKGEGEAEGWGKRDFPGSMHKRLLVITAVQVNPARAVLEHWKQGVTSILGPWEPCKKCKRSDCLFATDMAEGVQDLATFEASRQVRKLHLQPSVDTKECPGQSTLIARRETFLSTGCFWTSS